MNSSLWITGAKGFLGLRLVRALESRGVSAQAISRDRIDLAAPEAVAKLKELVAAHGAPKAVVHLASRQPGRAELSDFVRSNVLTTANVLESLAGQETRLIFASSLSVHVQPESRRVTSTSPVRASNAYTATKLAAESLVQIPRGSAASLILRLPSLYGLGQADSFIDGLARQLREGQPVELFGRGENYRDAIPVEDAVTVILHALECGLPSGATTVPIGNGAPITSHEYATELARMLGSSSAISRADRPVPPFLDLYADPSEARTLLGFEPTPWKSALENYARELRAAS